MVNALANDSKDKDVETVEVSKVCKQKLYGAANLEESTRNIGDNMYQGFSYK